MADRPRVSNSLLEYVVDQLHDVGGLRAQAMFGGVGLYAGDVFFGLLARNVLYLKVDDESRAVYVDAGSTPFRPYRDRPTTMSYYSVPLDVMEHAPTLVVWARRAVRAATASPPAPRRPPRAPKRRAHRPHARSSRDAR